MIWYDFTFSQIEMKWYEMKWNVNNKGRKDLLDLLLEAKDENGQGMSEQNIIDELMTFICKLFYLFLF